MIFSKKSCITQKKKTFSNRLLKYNVWTRFIETLLFSFSFYFFGRSNDHQFGAIKRLTLMLSVILTVMSIALKFHASPEFLPRDSITKHCFYHLSSKDVFIGLYSAGITYFPHLVIVTGFKYVLFDCQQCKHSSLNFRKSKTQFHIKSQKNMMPAAITYVFWYVHKIFFKVSKSSA